MQAKEIIMDLTEEQGTTRKSQVQPPLPVWRLLAILDTFLSLRNHREPLPVQVEM